MSDFHFSQTANPIKKIKILPVFTHQNGGNLNFFGWNALEALDLTLL